ncbi:DUF1697 domain-containing protein [Flavobacteriaceae bacterium GSB9]|nr:DUF1697 domain-containing protein [Flavobacteriaceae bacterium GSB9]
MDTFIALLRGINVSGQKKVPMANLRQLFTETGFEKVKTYIQSGNVVFQSAEDDVQKIERKIQKAIKDSFDFEVPVLVKTPSQLQQIFKACPFAQEKKENSYFVMLYSIPEKELVDRLKEISYPNETFSITENCVYFYCSTGYGQAKMNNNFFERKLKVTATARNNKTMVKLIAMLAES